MGRRRTNKRRRRKGGKLGKDAVSVIAKLKVKSHRWFQRAMMNHIKENAPAIQQIAAGNSNVRQNVTRLTHSDMQAYDAMVSAMVEHGLGALEDTATFVTLAGEKMVSIGNKGANVVAEYAPGMGQKLHDWFMPILNKSGTDLTAAFNIVKDKAGNAVGWLNFHKPEAPDLTKATDYVKNIYDKLPTKEKIMGFVKVDGKTFSFSVDGGVAKVKGLGSFMGKVGGYVKDKAGVVEQGAKAVGSAGLKGAQVVGSAGLKGAQVGAKFVMGGIKIGGKVIWTVGQPFVHVAKGLYKVGAFAGSGMWQFLVLIGKGLSVFWPVLEFFGKCVGGFFGGLGAILDAVSGGKRKRRTKRRRGRKRGRRRTKKKRRRTKKKRRRY